MFVLETTCLTDKLIFRTTHELVPSRACLVLVYTLCLTEFFLEFESTLLPTARANATDWGEPPDKVSDRGYIVTMKQLLAKRRPFSVRCEHIFEHDTHEGGRRAYKMALQARHTYRQEQRLLDQARDLVFIPYSCN